MAAASSESVAEGNEKSVPFICGVVEGFYGRPWTTEQRKDLFRKLKKWGMDSYVYAPKDDYKHRAYWRELYTVEEADHLTSLIAAAKEQGVVFYYALSPGLDMTYSSQKEVQVLKRKLEQVSQFGCEAFALLFDDIESELSKPDKEIFQTFANAQVSVTNEMFTHLNSPKFLFCPTQYCGTRAVTSVTTSEYLNTLGSKLHLDIDILWTGSKVISKILTLESIQEIAEVLRRPPVIWDNLHANDYDQKRVFLGPYSGRSPELIPYLRGVLTNPNCEFHANTVAIHTLASWSKCSFDNKVNSSLSADIKLETENEDGTSNEDIPISLSTNIYHPRLALKNAIAEWLPEFSIEKDAWGPISKPQPPVTMVMPIIPIIPSVNTCMSLTTTTTTTTTTASVPEVNTTQLQALAEVCSNVSSCVVNPISTSVMNSLVSPTKVITNEEIPNTIASNATTNIAIPKKIPISSIPIAIALNKDGDRPDIEIDDSIYSAIEAEVQNSADNAKAPVSNDFPIEEASDMQPLEDKALENAQMLDDSGEPMECGSSAASLLSNNMAKSVSEDVIMCETVSTCSVNSMQVESSESSLLSNAEMVEEVERPTDLTITADDLNLLCDLFYLPFEHGSRALQLLNEFNWLKANATVLLNRKKDAASLSEIQEWRERSDKFTLHCHSVHILLKKIASCPNKELCYDLFTYVWDISGALTLLNAFVKWLALGNFPANMTTYTQGSYTWFSKGWKETFMSGDQEPWVFRGGLTADFQRLMPVDSGNDLFLYKFPETPTSEYYLMRPYTHVDEEEVYKIFQQNFKETIDLLPENMRELLPDANLGPFLTLNSDLCILLHNSLSKIVGYAVAALDVKTFLRNQEMCWLPSMCEKYSQSLLSNPDVNPIVRDAVDSFHNFKYDKYECPQEVYNTHPSVMTMCVLKADMSTNNMIGKLLVTVLLGALRSNGSFGVHVRLSAKDCDQIQFYTKLGFLEIYRDTPEMYVYFGRRF